MFGLALLAIAFVVMALVFTTNYHKGRRETPALTVPVSPETGKVIQGRYDVLGKAFECTVCGHAEFAQREAQLNTAGLTFMKLDWMNETARCLVCKSCGYVHWFVT